MDWIKRLLRRRKGKDPEQAALLRRRGDELAAEGSLVEAAEAYEESLKLGEFDRAAYLKLAETYFDAYQPQEARDTLRKLVDAAPGDGETYRDVIKICLRRVKLNDRYEPGEMELTDEAKKVFAIVDKELRKKARSKHGRDRAK